jgi:ATP-dependent Clp protease ATP-binding subunit ClpC
VLLVLLQTGHETSDLLSRHGVRESDLLSALKVVDAEPASALEVTVERAQKIAGMVGEPARPVHLLYSVVRDPRTAGFKCLEHMGVGAVRVRADLDAIFLAPEAGEPAPSTPPPKSTAPSRSGLGLTPETAPRAPTPPKPRQNRRTAPKPPERAGRPSARARLERHKGPPKVENDVAADGATIDATIEVVPAALRPEELDPRAFPTLTAIGRNLTLLAAEGRIDPVVGRDREIEQLLDVLARRRSNNPILVGPPGVGKTAIVEGLARKLAASGGALAGLEKKIVIEVSSGSLVSGTGVRGALAERMQRVRDEVMESEGRVLLFIDEIHAVVGGDGPDDLAHELKAALARGELPCIGATTDAEYRRCFERDAALARRFSAIRVGEPSRDDALTILAGIAPRYEAHHGVTYADAALEAAVDLSMRYLVERQLPDKAIAVLDQAAARVRRRGGTAVERDAVAAVISELADVPVERLLAKDGDRLLELEGELEDRVVGHASAIERIADTLRKGAAGFRGKRPLGTFLLLGPTGVGKTEMAKAVADVVFPKGAMTRIDMSELSEAHAVARLLGAPPGYVGHDDGGQLTEAVRKRPYQLVLLDEVEKAHPDVLLALLPLLDEGRLTDARGRTVDFTNTIIFMTSNLGAVAKASAARIGFGADDAGHAEPRRASGEAAIGAARAALPPELWNRIDEPLFFAPLGRDDVREIARRMLSGIARTLAEERGVVLRVDPSAIDALIEAGGYDAALGARPMRRTIGRLVESALAQRILAGEVGEGDEVVVRGEGAELFFDRADVAAAE